MRLAFPAAAWARGASLALLLALIQRTAIAQGIIHTVPAQPLFYSYLPSSDDIDVNNDGIADFNLSSPNGIEIDLTPLNNNAILSFPEPPPDIGGFVYALPADAAISSSLDPVLVWFDQNWPGGTATIVACANIGCLGYFQGNTDAYAGIRLEAGGNFHYGWLHIQNGGLNFGQITDWAYETSLNTPILAGAVPEPSPTALLAVGVLSLLLLRGLRPRRNARSSSP